jgi:hypothetical protein
VQVTPNPITDARPDQAEKSMLRFMAANARRLKKDITLTPLGAFDTLQRIHKRWEDRWIFIRIVCWDGFIEIAPETPVQQALTLMEEHGGAAGILGLTIIARVFTFLKKPLKAGSGANERLDRAGNIAADMFLKIIEPIAFEKRKLREALENKEAQS